MLSCNGENIFTRLAQNTKVNGRGASDMAKVLRFGLMDPLIKDNGVMEKRKATASSCILMAPSMKVTGVMIKSTE